MTDFEKSRRVLDILAKGLVKKFENVTIRKHMDHPHVRVENYMTHPL